MARLWDRYKSEILPALKAELGLKNSHQVPRLQKIVVNMGVGKALENKRRLDVAMKDLATITGQKPALTRARRSISAFKLREGDSVGCKVTLRGMRMYEFLDRLIPVAMPRIRDFRGLDPQALDQAGNYSLGLTEQTLFPEITIDKVEFPQGMHVTLVIKQGGRDGGAIGDSSRALLRHFGMPFRSN